MDDAGEGLFAKKSLKQVDFAVALCDPSLKFPFRILSINMKGELVALMNGARSPPSLHQEWSDYRSKL